MRGIYFYPSIGNKDYPYTDWWFKRKESAWDILEVLTEKYNLICRLFRNKYKWSPDIVDKFDINRILRIFDETIEDNPPNADEEEIFE